MGKTITVITRFALRGDSETAGTDYAPDIVHWQGDNFVVVDSRTGVPSVPASLCHLSIDGSQGRTASDGVSECRMIHPRAGSF